MIPHGSEELPETLGRKKVSVELESSGQGERTRQGQQRFQVKGKGSKQRSVAC